MQYICSMQNFRPNLQVINSFDSKEKKEKNKVNSFTKRSTVCYSLIELILHVIGNEKRRRERENRMMCSVELYSHWLVYLNWDWKNEVKNGTPVVHLSASSDAESIRSLASSVAALFYIYIRVKHKIEVALFPKCILWEHVQCTCHDWEIQANHWTAIDEDCNTNILCVQHMQRIQTLVRSLEHSQ